MASLFSSTFAQRSRATGAHLLQQQQSASQSAPVTPSFLLRPYHLNLINLDLKLVLLPCPVDVSERRQLVISWHTLLSTYRFVLPRLEMCLSVCVCVCVLTLWQLVLLANH